MNGWTDGQTDGWTDGRTDGWTDGWTDKVECRVALHATKKGRGEVPDMVIEMTKVI